MSDADYEGPDTTLLATSEAATDLGDLLHQSEIWQPQHGPALRLAEMTDTHRYHLLGWLEKRAKLFAKQAEMSMAFGGWPTGELAQEWHERELHQIMWDPDQWMRDTALYRALIASLPKRGSDEWNAMLARTVHWSTCPRNRDITHDTCTCNRKGQK